MDEPQTNTLNAPVDSKSEREPEEWVTPTLEEFSLKDALSDAGQTVVDGMSATS